jgi:hypothetical protein
MIMNCNVYDLISKTSMILKDEERVKEPPLTTAVFNSMIGVNNADDVCALLNKFIKDHSYD